jgi:hypothetical protein
MCLWPRYVLYAKTPEEKQAWLDSFIMEREKVARDKDEGMSVVLKDVSSDKDGTTPSPMLPSHV